ncbi:MAG TPA: hypothetical protein VFG20_05615 [Planctomycetaceae bacterium]|nr:hypothetical protein [Planctomycetaceae bacterium]
MKLIADARREAAEELALELSDRDQRMTEFLQKLKTAQDAELAMRQRERELQARTEELQL